MDNPASLADPKDVLGKFKLASPGSKGGHIRAESVTRCAAALKTLVGGVTLSEVKRLLTESGQKAGHYNVSGESFAPRPAAQKALATEVAVHALLTAESTGSVPAWATAAGLTIAGDGTSTGTDTDAEAPELGGTGGAVPGTNLSATFAAELQALAEETAATDQSLPTTATPLSDAELKALVRRLATARAAGRVLTADGREVLRLAATARAEDVAAARRLGASLPTATPPYIPAADDEVIYDGVVPPSPLVKAGAAVRVLRDDALGDLADEAKMAKYEKAAAALAKLKRHASDDSTGGVADEGRKKSRTADVNVVTSTYADQEDVKFDAMVRQYQSSRLQEAIDAGHVVGGFIAQAVDGNAHATLPRKDAKQLALHGKFDTSFSSLLGPGASRTSDCDITIDEYTEAATMWGNTVVMRWPRLRPRIAAYVDMIRGFAKRFRKELPQGFAMYDIAYRRKVTLVYGAYRTTPNFGRDQDVFAEVFSGVRASLCVRCGACDHYVRECTTQAGPSGSRGRGAKGSGERVTSPPVGTGVGGDRKPAVCFKFNRKGGCKEAECRFAHACQLCGGDHTKMACRE